LIEKRNLTRYSIHQLLL